jgi:hypothetical protein
MALAERVSAGERPAAAIDVTSAVVWALAGVTVVAGLAVRIAIAWRGLETLAVKVLPDDAFYYFLTADHISNGHNVTFDGFTVSNGYHPLWLFSLVPFYLIPGRSLPLHLALTFSSFLDVFAGVLVAASVLRLTGNRVAALFSLGIYMFLPQNVFNAVNGVESSMASVMLAALLLAVVSVWRAPRVDWLRWALVTGALGGLTVLARLDSVLAVAGAFGAICVCQSGPVRWRAPLVAAAVVAVMVAPWFIWSMIATGSATPVSAASTTWLLRQSYLVSHPDASLMDKAREGWRVTKHVVLKQMPGLYLPARTFATLMLAGAAAIAAHLMLFSRGAVRRERARQAAVVGLPLAGFVVMLLINSAYRWSVRSWYFAWGMPTVILAAGVLFDHLHATLSSLSDNREDRLPKQVQGLFLYGALALFLAVAYVGPARDAWRTGHYPFQQDNVTAGLYLKEHVGPDARIATFNAGVIGYFSERSVVNIDGVVNPKAYEAMRDHRLIAYLRSIGVDYAADRDGAWTYLPLYIRKDDWSKSLWGEDPNKAFVQVQQLSQPVGFFPAMRLWRLKP